MHDFKLFFIMVGLVVALQQFRYSVASPINTEQDLANYETFNYSDEQGDREINELKALEALVNAQNSQQQVNSDNSSEDIDEQKRLIIPVPLAVNRNKRRLSVFKNVYNKCRVQKRKDKDLCLYLANLYQTVKGFHGF